MSSSVLQFLTERMTLRERNRNPQPGRMAFAEKSPSLTSNLKKATALAKRFKDYSAEASEKVILDQLDVVSFAMFTSEAAQGVVQSLCQGTKMKASDAHSFVVVCSEVHQRYESFWPLVQKGVKENAEKVVSMEELKAAIQRMEVGAAPVGPSGGDGNAGAGSLGSTASSNGVASAAPGSSNNTLSTMKAPMEELNHLRLVVKVTCEWWLAGLLDDAKPVLAFLRLLHGVVEKRLSAPLSPSTTAAVLSLSAFIIREVGIEILGGTNAVVSRLFGAEGTVEDTSVQLSDLANYHGPMELTTGISKPKREDIFFVGSAGVRRVFNPTTKTSDVVDEASLQQAVELSAARLRCVRIMPGMYDSTDAEKEQFFALAVTTSKVALKSYLWHKTKLEEWWQLLGEQRDTRGNVVKTSTEDMQFRALAEQVERLHVTCDNLLGMLGYATPPPVKLTVLEPRVAKGIVVTSATKKFYAVSAAETLNRFESDEQRIFYEYVPDFLIISDELLKSLLSEKPSWDSLGRQGVLAQSPCAGVTDAREKKAHKRKEEGEGKDTASNSDTRCVGESRSPSYMKVSTTVERRLWLAWLAVPATLFDEYAVVLQLLEELEQCRSADAIDKWCVQYMQEALRPLEHSSGSVALGSVFFTNCRMLLAMEVWYSPWVQQPDMVPYLSRCIAEFSQYFPDMSEFIAGRLDAHWKSLCKADSGISEEKLRDQVEGTVRYICDLTKFGAIAHLAVFSVLRVGMEDLHGRISPYLISSVMKYCGFFLSRNQTTRQPFNKALGKLESALSKTTLNDEGSDLIRASLDFLHVPSAPRRPVAQVERSPLELYVRHLLNDVLSRQKYKFVCEKLVKVPWEDPAKRNGLVATLRDVQHLKWDNIPLLADLLADLGRAGHESLVLRIVETVAEDLRRDLEVVPRDTEVEAVEMTEEIRYYAEASQLHAEYRSMSLRLLDCVFITHLCRARVLSFRFVSYIVAQLLCYTPHPNGCSPDCSRLRCCVSLLSGSLTFLPWQQRDSRSRSAERLAGLHQLMRKMMALLFVHRYTIRALPLDLSQRLDELVSQLDECMRQGSGVGQPKGRDKHRGGEEKERSQDSVSESTAPPPGMRLPKSLQEAEAYAKVVEEEHVLPANVWYDRMCEKMRKSCREDFPHCRISSVQVRAASSSQVESTVAENVEENLMGLSTQDVDHVYDAVSSHGSDAGESYARGEYDVSTQSDGSSDESPDFDSDYSHSSTLSGFSRSDSDMISEENEDDDMDDEDDEEEEYSDVEEEEYSDDEEEEEEDEDEDEDEDDDNKKIAAAEALRLRIEEANLDAKLRALMSETQRDGIFRAASAATKGGAAERLIKQELTAGIRLHRQQQRSQQPHEESANRQEMKFVVLRRPVRGGGSTNTKPGGTSAGADPHGASANEGVDRNTLTLPRDTEFARSALHLQEQHRRQRDELREVTLRINRMQESERR
ncbi:MIF4G domain containing protein [Trypanosoma brucei equiperdum]|uniref:MIF4G domain containing protein n=1 Tax=Trypanosoma brucei equiperdum TaxID=630700 RepID=A0A3L6KRH6_9TRYP|nr:MIF4G domain containing protein [Trypanosoma brucei equiperdum]